VPLSRRRRDRFGRRGECGGASNREQPLTPQSWSITTNLGATALSVAAQRAAETAQANPLIRDEFAALLVGAVDEPGWQTLASGDLSWLGSEDDIRRRTARAGREYVATRTIFFDDFCAAAIDSGIHQVVILAAGLDARAYRLPCLSGVLVYEIDQPAVHDFKASVLQSHGATPRAELRSVPVDLRDAHWPDALESVGWQRSSSTAWLVEGLLPYLTSAEHDQLFRVVTRLSASGSHLAAEVYHHQTAHLGEQRLTKWREEADAMADEIGAGVDVTQYIKHQDTRDTESWLTRNGWTTASRDSHVEMAHLGRPIPDDLADIAPASALVTAIRN
jgi:methyltransferase (TIGR00027 family)